ncbi:MFS transporter [Spiractinospora alimapuensis]|uniref:MFS transporter n=1 Tax=Spiractinospora alimapuensis TaxID=2820884 RepID=UPI001F2D98E3|nr:MFS transporter [Spiractinospora alimapuensis]QVQ52556.1 MFS transporter [Spiractinospora alimapuensis]
MTVDDSAPPHLSPATRSTVQRRTLLVLSTAQVIGGIAVGSALAVGALVAQDITNSETWAGLATTMVTLGAALFALPLAAVASRHGRRVSLGLGWLVATLGGLVVILAAQIDSFGVFLLGMVLFGSGTATNLQARYAAADLATDATRARDLSLVVWATTIGAVTGPNLTGPGTSIAATLGLTPLSGSFVLSTAAFGLAGLAIAVALRPDPLLLSRTGSSLGVATRGRTGVRSGIAAVRSSPNAVLAMTTIALGHGVMVGTMTMTPVHMSHDGAALTVVGLTISLHIAGMYALSPVVGWLADRLGRVRVILVGQAVLLLAVACAGAAGHNQTLLTTGLVLLGLGWSFAVVAGSALLSESLAPEARPSAQGSSDLVMNLVGAGCGAASGTLVATIGFTGLNVVGAALTAPVILLGFVALRRAST